MNTLLLTSWVCGPCTIGDQMDFGEIHMTTSWMWETPGNKLRPNIFFPFCFVSLALSCLCLKIWNLKITRMRRFCGGSEAEGELADELLRDAKISRSTFPGCWKSVQMDKWWRLLARERVYFFYPPTPTPPFQTKLWRFIINVRFSQLAHKLGFVELFEAIREWKRTLCLIQL